MAIPKMTIWQRQAYRLALMAHVMVHHIGPMVWWLGSGGMIITSHYGDPSAGLVSSQGSFWQGALTSALAND